MPKSFSDILALVLAATTALIVIAGALAQHQPDPVIFETMAWLAICCTYFGTALAELLFGPRRGLQRLVDHPWSIRRLYAAILFSLLGALTGLAILVFLTGRVYLLLGLATGLVLGHFFIRHFTTEAKRTPHLGQRGPKGERILEVFLGQIADLYLVGILLAVWALTKNPIWILATAIFLAGYMLGVWIHRRFDPEPRTVSSYVGALACLAVMCGFVLILGFEPQVPNILREVEWALAIVAAVVVLDRRPYVAKILAAVGVMSATVYGYLVGQDQVATGFKEMLFNPEAEWRRIRDYWVMLAVFSFVINTAFSRVLELLLGERGLSAPEDQ